MLRSETVLLYFWYTVKLLWKPDQGRVMKGSSNSFSIKSMHSRQKWTFKLDEDNKGSELRSIYHVTYKLTF